MGKQCRLLVIREPQQRVPQRLLGTRQTCLPGGMPLGDGLGGRAVAQASAV
jgi:hypothetical protein